MAGLPFPGIGVVFDIEALGGGYYGYRAWKIFMKALPAGKIKNTILKEGDTGATLAGAANEFCIAVYGPALDIGAVRAVFERLPDEGLSPLSRRFILKPQLDDEPLPIRGKVDIDGYFVTDEWMRIDHDLCKETNWKYRPEKVPADLPENLKRELELMGR